jgi:cytoskeletal protein CcmA (bactofilin family)
MNWTLNPQFRITILILIIFSLFFGLTHSAQAQGINYGNEVAAGETVENDIILSGDTINLDGTVLGDVIAIGSNVNINGTVEGSLITLGRFLTINGQVNGTTYALGRELILDGSANLDRNLYFLGFNLETLEGSNIGRDLLALTLGALMNGEVGRDVRAISGVNILKVISELVRKEMSGLPIQLPGIFAYGEQPHHQVEYAGVFPLANFLAVVNPQTGNIDTQRLSEWALARLRELVTLFVFGMLGIWLFPRQLNRTVEVFRAKWLRSLGLGLLGLVVFFNVIIVALLVAALIIAIGYGLSAITLMDLAWVVLGVGLACLGVAFTILWLFVIFGTKAIVAYVGGRLILDRLAPRTTRYKIVPLLLGLIIYVILHGIPILGPVIAILATAIGLGLAWLVWRNSEIITTESVNS